MAEWRRPFCPPSGACVAALLMLCLVSVAPVRAGDVPEFVQGYNQKVRDAVEALDLAKAEALAQEFVDVAKRRYGETDLIYGDAISRRGAVYMYRHDFMSARPLFEDALKIYGSHGDDPRRGRALNNLAESYRQTGDLSEAERLYKEALALQQSVLEEGHPDEATTLANLAHIHRQRGQFGVAEQFLRQALEIRRQHYEPDDPTLATTYQNLAAALEEQNKLEDAETWLRKAIATREAGQHPDHPQLAGALQRLGVNLYRQFKWQEAYKVLRRSVKIRRKTEGFRSDFGRNLTDLAQLFLTFSKWDRAEPLLREAMEVYSECCRTRIRSRLPCGGTSRSLQPVREISFRRSNTRGRRVRSMSAGRAARCHRGAQRNG